MDTLGEFSADQLAAVGMAGQDCTAIRVDAEAEYKRFHRFWNLRLQPLDPDFDLPAKRMINAEFHARLHARTDADRASLLRWQPAPSAPFGYGSVEKIARIIGELYTGPELTRNRPGSARAGSFQTT